MQTPQLSPEAGRDLARLNREFHLHNRETQRKLRDKTCQFVWMNSERGILLIGITLFALVSVLVFAILTPVLPGRIPIIVIDCIVIGIILGALLRDGLRKL